MDEFEDGELPSSPDVSEEPYKPLPRPIKAENVLSKSIQDSDENETNVDENSVPGLFNDSDEDSDDSDDESHSTKKRRFGQIPPSLETKNDGGGQTFRQMAAKFQANAQKSQRNNVWGSILQEETLSSEMTGIGVGRTLKDVCSDRGAETYDYHAASGNSSNYDRRKSTDSIEAQHKREAALDELDSELSDYWNNRKSNAITAGKKRSIKDRLGSRVNSRDSNVSPGPDCLENMSIPPPGVPR